MYNQTIQFPEEFGHQYTTTRRPNVATFFLCTAQKLRMIFAFLKGYIREKMQQIPLVAHNAYYLALNREIVPAPVV